MESVTDPFLSKRKEQDRRNITGSALAGAGAVTASTGLAAGGIPGTKPNAGVFMEATEKLKEVRDSDKKAPRKAAQAAREGLPAVKQLKGGILGFRTAFHAGGTEGFKQKALEQRKAKTDDAADAFKRGRNVGKISPEIKVMHGMGRGRLVANTAMVGGAGVTAYGLHHRKDKVSKRDRKTDTYNATLLGAGTAGAAVSHGGAKYLDSHKRRYQASASKAVDQAGDLIPKIAGRQGQRMSMKQMDKFKRKNGHQGKAFDDIPWPKTMYPKVSDEEIRRKPKLLRNADPSTASQAGVLRGKAAQERHFAEVFDSTAKAVRRFRTPSAVVAGVGAGGLLVASNKKDKVKKSLGHEDSPFLVSKNLTQAQIDRKKKVQAATSITTSTLGLTALGATGVAAAPGAARWAAKASKGRLVLKPGKKLKNVARKAEKAKVPLLTTSAGIGGVGGYNFAAYTRAEAKQRKKNIPAQ